MKILFYLTAVILMISCKSTTNAQQNSDSISTKKTMKNQKPRFSERDIYVKVDPNGIELIGKIVHVEHNKTLCDKNYEYIVKIKPQGILNSGFGVVNKLSAKRDFKAIFSKKLLPKNIKSPNQFLDLGDLYTITVIEKLCKDASKTNYFINNITKKI